MGTLYYKTDDGVYHSIGEIETVEDIVTKLDEKLLEGCEGVSTIKDLREGEYFEADVKMPEGFMEELDNWISEIINAHEKYCEISWICELAKRYLKEHSEKRYLVVADGYEFSSYGSEMFLLGDFSSKEKAEECVKENIIKNPYHEPEDTKYDLVPRIIEINGDTVFPLVKKEYCDDEYRNDYYIGGYIE